MTDHKALIFGSFTEDEIKSLQSQPVKDDVGITFGSLDSATLRSVGIYNTKLTNVDYSKGTRPSQLANKGDRSQSPNIVEDTLAVVASGSEINGTVKCIPGHYGSSEKLKPPSHVGSPSCRNVSDVPYKAGQMNARNIVNEVPSSFSGLALLDSSEGTTPKNSKKSIHQEANGPVIATSNLIPRGLVNLGNLCFLNASLQALLSCSPFVELLQELRLRAIPQLGYPTLQAFIEFIADFDMPMDMSSKRKDMLVMETGKPFRPLMFESILGSFTPDVQNSLSGRPRQEDAQEFLSFVMHQMHDELLKLDGQLSNGSVRNSLISSVAVGDDDNDNWETVCSRNKSAVTRTQSLLPSKLSAIFGGQLRSVVKARGTKASATIEPFLLLHLNICPDPVCTIEDALQLFSAPETLEGYKMSAAGKAEVVSASKSVKIMELSKIMILHLMRFTYGSQGSTKLHKPVHFPLELVLGRELLVSPSSEGRKYELVGTITHHGRDPSKGHYTADARHPNGSWLRYDDASVTPIPTKKVLHDQAYVLFYKQL
ncbi:cysteine protease [Lithospermum erythrorhizon]|uniref:Ubiquitin carboxyl-terminal hydrolase n=1 Tax=Lithospermum erythrorhizon TaxID=34254 RepID=A0AAV3NU90_LITER